MVVIIGDEFSRINWTILDTRGFKLDIYKFECIHTKFRIEEITSRNCKHQRINAN